MSGPPPLRLLVFVGTEGMHHDHLGQGRFLAEALASEGSIRAECAQDYGILADGLDPYDVVLFYTDVGRLTPAQEQGLLRHVEQGRGFVGLHTAAASFREAAGYHRMLNARFDGHSPHMEFRVTVTDPDDPITAGLTDFAVTDELYYLIHDPARSHHLLQAYDPTRDQTHVMSFRHAWGQGRVFYLALGHDRAVLANPSFQQVARRGAQWAGRRLAP